jgi:hypothetical protein
MSEPNPPPPAGVKADAPQEYVYKFGYDDQTHERVLERHPVLKRTTKQVFIRFKPGGVDRTYGDYRDESWLRIFSLDRQELEAKGAVAHAGYIFFLRPPPQDRKPKVPPHLEALRQFSKARIDAYERQPCLVTLGLEAGATLAQVKEAFRDLALQHHPDRGGDPAAFHKIREAYGEALMLLKVVGSRCSSLETT